MDVEDGNWRIRPEKGNINNMSRTWIMRDLLEYKRTGGIMTAEEAMDMLEDEGIATIDEIQLVININGYSKQTLRDILYARTGNRDFDQYLEDAERYT